MAQKEMFSGDVTKCARCAIPCRKQPGNPEARLLKHTTSDFGYCANCAATEFFQGLDVVKYAGGYDSATGRAKKLFEPACFRLERVQQLFASILAAGQADANPDEIDWMEIVANWHLPFPKLRQRRKKKVN